MPHHGSLRGIPDYGPVSRGGVGRVDAADSRGEHGIYVPPGPVRSRAARRRDPVEGESRAGAGSVTRAGGPGGDGAEWNRAGELRGVVARVSLCALPIPIPDTGAV